MLLLEFPHKVNARPWLRAASNAGKAYYQQLDEMVVWCLDNLNRGDWLHDHLQQFEIRHLEDATMFRLTWSDNG